MKHWTEDDFLRWLYAGSDRSAPMQGGHLNDCPECRFRADRMLEARRDAIKVPELSPDFLTAQRRKVYRRLGVESGWLGNRSRAGRWALAMLSFACILVFSLTSLHPWTAKNAVYSSSDEKLFSDLVSIEQSSEPRAIRPIHSLFQE
jgi:hypothetical protein